MGINVQFMTLKNTLHKFLVIITILIFLFESYPGSKLFVGTFLTAGRFEAENAPRSVCQHTSYMSFFYTGKIFGE